MRANTPFRLGSTRRWVALAMLAGTACSRVDRPIDEEVLASRPIAAGYRAYEMEWARIIAPDIGSARALTGEVRAAAAAFHTYFGVRVPAGCLRIVGAAPAPPCDTAAPWTMEWRARERAREGRESGPAVEAGYHRLVEFGFVVDSPLARRAASLGGVEECRKDHAPLARASLLRHELLHLLFLRFVWPKSGETLQYGGDAPDWLDEAAAIVGEPPNLVRSRRARFAAMLEQGRVIPLRRFLTMEHPSMPSVRATPRPPRGVTTVTIRRVPLNDPVTRQRLDFYAQTRAYLDFLHHRAGHRALADIASSLRQQPGDATPPVVTDAEDRRFRAWAMRQQWAGDEAVCG